MDINKKNRTDLKAFFVKNAIPTETNFADLLDAGINQKEDGIAKLAGDPLSIQAEGGANSTQKLINFYADFSDSNPSWMISQNPREVANNPATAKPGFNIASGNGTPRLFISNNGKIGIGTITPVSALDVKGSISINGQIRIDSSGWFNSYGNTGWRNSTHGGGWNMTDSIWIRSAGSKDVYVNKKLRADQGFEVGSNGSNFKVFSDGKIGIGASSLPPLTKLAIVGNSGSLRLFSGKASGHTWIGMYNGSSPSGPRQAWFGFGSDSAKAFTIRNEKSGGTISLNPVGGITQVVGNLQVSDNTHSGKGIMLGNRDRPMITTGFDPFTSGSYNGVGRWGMYMQPSVLTIGIPNIANKFIRFRVFNSNSSVAKELMSIGQNGRVGIGTPSPEGNLHIKAAAGLSSKIILEADPTNNNENAHPEIILYQDGKRAMGRIRFATSGNRNNDLYIQNHTKSGTSWQNSGYIILKHGNSIQVSKLPLVASDISLKKNITNLSYGLNEILKLKPVSYHFKGEKGKAKSLGLIAQDVQKVISEVVESGPANGKEEKLHLGYSALIPVLINAIKELNQKIEKLSGKPE